MSWKKTIQPVSSSWKDTITPDEGVSKLESLLLGGSEGVSSGFVDELGGAMSFAGRALGITDLGGKLGTQGLDSPTLDLDTLKNAYTKTRDETRAIHDQARQANPTTFATGEIGGAIGQNFLVPGLGVAKGAPLLKTAVNLGAQGGAAGLGMSEADNLTNAAWDTGAGVLLGVGGGVAAHGVGAAANAVGKGLSNTGKSIGAGVKALENTPINNLDELLAASERLGIKPVEAMKTSNPAFQKLESGLSQSGSFPAMSVRDDYTNLFKGIDDAGEKINSLKTPDSDFSIGKSIKEQLANEIKSRKAPVTELYNDVVPDLQKIPVNPQVVNREIGALKRDPIFQTKAGIEFLDEHKNILLDNPDLASLKEYRSSLKGLVGDTASPQEKMRVDAFRRAVTNVRDKSINTMKTDLPKEMHGEVDDLINRIALADTAHAGNVNDINSIKSILGNKDVNSPSTFLDKIGGVKEADLAQKAANLDITSLVNMKEKFPAVFDKARTAKINEMVQAATNPQSGFNEVRFFKQFDSLDPELQDLLFTPEMKNHIMDLQTVKRAVPPKLGPSGTPEGIMSMDMFNPKRNAQDYLIKKSLGGGLDGSKNFLQGLGQKTEAIGNGLQSGGATQQILQSPAKATPWYGDDQRNEKPKTQMDIGASVQSNPQAFGKYAQVLQNAAQRGPHGVASTHFILQQTDPGYRETINKLNDDEQPLDEGFA